MPEAVVVSVSRALADMIAAAAFDVPVTVARSYAEWDKKLEVQESEGVTVDVVAVATRQPIDLATRGGRLRYAVSVDVVTRRRLSVDDVDPATKRIKLAAIDPLLLIVQQIHELLAWQLHEPLAAYPAAKFVAVEVLANPLKAHLRELRQFTSVVRVTFHVHRQAAGS